MIPYFQQPSVDIGPLTIHAFGVLVARGVFAGLLIGERRFAALGLDREVGGRMAWWIIVAGFLGAHLFAVLFYFPRLVLDDPLVLLRLWDHISSFGGIIGGGVGLWLFFRWKAPEIEPAARVAYLDVAAFVFPISLMIGRIGCALAHDHPGAVTSFPIAISLESAAAQEIAPVSPGAGSTTPASGSRRPAPPSRAWCSATRSGSWPVTVPRSWPATASSSVRTTGRW